MKSTPAALVAHMAQGSTTLAVLNKITRRDGEIMAITLDHDRPLTYQGVVYEPKFGAMPSTIETTGALNVDNVDIKGALLALGVNEADIAAGLWDGAHFIAYRVNWRDLSMGAEILKSGTFGQISTGRGTFTQEVRGITQKLQQVLGEVVSPACKADLFDAKCGVPMTEGVWKFSDIAVSTVVSPSQFATLLPSMDGLFDGGRVVFATGANAGLAKEIRGQITGNIWLQEPMPYPISVGDVVTLYAGCLKRFTEDCLGKFNNPLRFRGFKDVPGQDQMFRGPDGSGGSSGGGAAAPSGTTTSGTGTVTSTGTNTGTITASVSGAVVGPVTGTVTGSGGSTGTVTGTVTLNPDGTGTLTGTVSGNVTGAVTVVLSSAASTVTPPGTGTGTLNGYVRAYVPGNSYLVYGTVTGNASQYVKGTISLDQTQVAVSGYVRHDGNNSGFFVGQYAPSPGSIQGAVSGALVGSKTEVDLNDISLYINTKAGYEGYLSWIPRPSSGVPAYTQPYDTDGQVLTNEIDSVTLRLHNFIADGAGSGTQYFALDFHFPNGGGQAQNSLLLQFYNMPQTFSNGPVTIGPFQSVGAVASAPAAGKSQADYEKLVRDFYIRKIGNTTVSLYRSYRVSTEAERTAFAALDGTTISTPGASMRSFRTSPNFADPYWESRLVNKDGTSGFNL